MQVGAVAALRSGAGAGGGWAGGQGFLSTYSGDKLSLTGGFIFFGGLFEKDDQFKNVSISATYLSISAALQFAREIEDVEQRLKSSTYESVVLSPECFLRFNDDILQASLLRASHPSELDYSSSPHLSMLMREIIGQIFDRYNLPYGNASLEFAAALATCSHKLKAEDLNGVLDNAIGKMKDQPSALLGLLLLARYARQSFDG